MGQGIGGVPQAPAVGGDAGGREPIGRYIAQQRRLRGIDLEELALRTRIPRRSLERLEAGAFDQSPDGFSRGFVRTVAEAIGLDPDDAVARMLPEPDAVRRGSPRAGRVLGALAAFAALATVALALRALVFSPEAPAVIAADGRLPVRRDFVRALAEAQGIDPAALTARAAVLAPLPPEIEAPPAVADVAETAGEPVSAPRRAEVPVAQPAASTRPPSVLAESPAQAPSEPPPAREVAAARPEPTSESTPTPTPTPTPAPGATAPPASASAASAASPIPQEVSPAAAPSPDAEDHD